MPKHRGNIRKRRANDEDEEDNVDGQQAEEDVLREQLEATKRAQQLRKKVQGVDVNFLPNYETGEEQGAAPGVQDSKLMESFDRARGNLDGVVLTEDAQMKEYIEAQLAARLKRKATSEPLTAAAAAQARQLQMEQELYAIPENVVVPKGQTEVVIPGLITGISEVQLPVEARLSSIEQTEQMKRKLLAASVQGSSALEEDDEPLRRPGCDPNTNPFHRRHFVPVLGRHKRVKDKDEKEELVKQYRYIKDPTISWKKR